jgi:hypothetical protein
MFISVSISVASFDFCPFIYSVLFSLTCKNQTKPHLNNFPILALAFSFAYGSFDLQNCIFMKEGNIDFLYVVEGFVFNKHFYFYMHLNLCFYFVFIFQI